jgi:hypothetical protein
VRYIYDCNYFDVLGPSTTLDCPEVVYHYLMYSSAVAGAKFDTSEGNESFPGVHFSFCSPQQFGHATGEFANSAGSVYVLVTRKPGS